MQWIWIATGLAVLLAAALLTWLLRRAKAHVPLDGHTATAAYRRCKLPSKLLSLLRQALHCSADTQDVTALLESAHSLMEHILHLRRRLHASPPLPQSDDDEPRLMEPARETADLGTFTVDALIEALTSWHSIATPAEVHTFPLCIATAQCQRLVLVLRSLLADSKVRRAAKKIALRICKSKQPHALLDKANLNPAGLSELVKTLREQEQHPALATVEHWLSLRNATPGELAMQDTQRQVQLAEEIRRCMACLDALARLNWLEQCEQADELHSLLMDDPADIYPRMDVHARMELRLQVENISRRVRIEPAEVIRHALRLCDAAEPRSLERYVGYWFQDAEGMKSLHRVLPSKKGRLYARYALRRETLRYAVLWGVGIVAGFVFLHSGEPVFMLPFFTLTIGCASRYLVRRIADPRPPRMDLSRLSAPVKSLVVLSATLHDTHEAIRMVRRLKTARHAFPPTDVDYLLLGDFAPGMTAVSSSDAAIIKAASTALSALQDEAHVFYLQRGRVWDGEHHTYAPRGGKRGAINEICRLIAQGECEDVIAYSTIEPAQLERNYDYILALPEDRQVYPGMFEQLLKTMTHPLCSRYPTGTGWRGFSVLSPEPGVLFEGVGLIRPDAYLEATDGLLDPSLNADALSGELAGHTVVRGARMQSVMESNAWDALYAHALTTWQMAAWQLPWVKTPSGLLNNPLRWPGRFRLRESLRLTLVPLGQALLLLWTVLTQNWPLLFIALLAPEIGQCALRWESMIRAGCRLSLLPTRMMVQLRAMLDALRHKSAKTPSWVSLEVWAQGIAATLFAALVFLYPAFSLPALGLSVLFACFPLAHRVMDAPVKSDEGLTNEQFALLDDTAASTWKFFSANVSVKTAHLPPCRVQFEPELPVDQATSPEAIGAYLLAIICAKDLGYLSASDAALRIHHALDSLQTLSLPFGLPCRLYALPSLTVLDAHTDAQSAAIFTAALMTTAQALRTWLPELPVKYASLSAEAEKLLAALDPTTLYDQQAGLFRLGLDENGQGVGYVHCFADEALLLSICACARKQIPPDSFDHLSRACVRLNKADIPLSMHGTTAEHLLASLFVQTDEVDAHRYIQAMEASSQDGLIGQGASAYWGFHPDLSYHRAIFGLQSAAVLPTQTAPVFAPYAAALCLSAAPRQAADALSRFYALGAKGPEGFCDAVDLRHGPALIGLHDAYHQGLILLSAAHLLADTPIRRYFCAIPEVEACLPLLERKTPTLVLPPLPAQKPHHAFLRHSERTSDPFVLPPEMHLLGSDFRLLTDTQGNSVMFDGDVPLTASDPDTGLRGVQFYLADEGRVYRIGSALLQGQAVFSPGETRYEQLCGSLRAELSCCVDTIRRRTLHVLTITNLSTRDRLIELADFLLPGLDASPATLETTRPEKGRLTLHARSTGQILHHTMNTSMPALGDSVCTDALAFTGRNRTLHQPASLEDTLHDLTDASTEPCLSFRARFSIGGRGQFTAWFTTSLHESAAPQLSELPGIRRLAAMQHAAIDDASGLTDVQMQITLRLIGFLEQAGQQLTLVLTSSDQEEALTDLLAALSWFQLHRMQIQLCIVASAEVEDQLVSLLDGHAEAAPLRIIRPEVFSRSDHPLCLTGDLPLLEQLDALTSRLHLPSAPSKQPFPAKLPHKELLHPSNYGGFEPETLDYIIQLEPGQTTPAPWRNTHVSRYFRETTDESGFRAPFEEQIWLSADDGTLLSLWSVELPRSVRMRPGETDWEAWSDQLDIRLRATALPGHRCGIRSLHIHNATDHPLTLRITVSARLSSENAPLECASGIVMTDTPGKRLQAYIAGEGWHCRRIHAHAASVVTEHPCIHAPDSSSGDTALLHCELHLEPQRSGKVVWLAGFARHGEDIARALTDVQQQTTSDLLRAAQTPWTQRLSKITISTPEDTLDLLLNRILPVQALSAIDAASLPVLSYLSPSEAKRALLQHARKPLSRDEWARFALLIAHYTRVTGDARILHARIPPTDADLLHCCKDALVHTPLDRQGLPQGEAPTRRSFLYAVAANALERIHPDPELQEFSRKLLNAADTYLWQDGCYGDPLQLDVQCLACEAYGANARTRQTMSACWTTLYDQLHGLIRRQMPNADQPILPGLPENGGMTTLDAVHCLRALLRTDHRENAFELLRALNPIHHTDDPLRMETFRCAPYQLHGGMYASPLEAGRAVPDGGHEAAAQLYAVVLEDILGFHREGHTIRLTPNVPPDWEDYSITLREGASTWHISAERRIRTLTIDGTESSGNTFTLTDDGKVHQIRFPLT